jgi:hypothetical protein
MQDIIPEEDHNFYLGREWDVIYGAPFWFTFIREAERRLSSIGVVCRGTAVGDLALPNCVYASLRNEAFVMQPVSILNVSKMVERRTGSESLDEEATTAMNTTTGKELVYPPNGAGWNAAGHEVPYLDLIFFLRQCSGTCTAAVVIASI